MNDVGNGQGSHGLRSDRVRRKTKRVEYFSTTSRAASYPRQPVATDPVAQHVADDGRIRVGGRKESVELRRAPVGDAGHDDFLHVGHHVPPVLALDRRFGRHQLVQITGLDGGQHGPANNARAI